MDIDPNFGDPSARPPISLIPLALSERGIRAIESAGLPGLVGLILDQAKNIHSRRVYVLDEEGNQTQVLVPYGPNGEVFESHMFPEAYLIFHSASIIYPGKKSRSGFC